MQQNAAPVLLQYGWTKPRALSVILKPFLAACTVWDIVETKLCMLSSYVFWNSPGNKKKMGLTKAQRHCQRLTHREASFMPGGVNLRD